MTDTLQERLRAGADDLTPYCLGDVGAPPIDVCLPAYLREAAAALDARDAEIARLRGDWLPIETAPKDGTPILAWCVHPNARFVGDSQAWAAPVVAQWITHNGGGWTWNGISGSFTHWRPLPSPPEGEKG